MNGTYLRTLPIPFVLFSLAPSGDLFSGDYTGIGEVAPSGAQVAHIDLDWKALAAGPGQVAVDAAGDIFLPLQDDSSLIALLEFDQSGSFIGEWAGGCETMIIAPDGQSIYCAYSGPPDWGWPYLRKYALPKS